MDLASSEYRENSPWNHSIQRRFPLLAALLVQFLSFLFCFLSVKTLFSGIAWVYFPFLVLLSHCLIVSVATFLLGMEWWWVVIQALFPVALVFGLSAGLPVGWSVLAFILLFLIHGAVFRSRVPYFPSSKLIPDLLLHALSVRKEERLMVLDVGSGFGGLLLAMAKRKPDWYFHGVEIAILPWMVSRIKSLVTGVKNAQWQYTDYHSVNFAGYDVVYVYLSPVVMDQIWRKAQAEMLAGSWLVSYEFPINGKVPDCVLRAGDDRKELYIWQIK